MGKRKRIAEDLTDMAPPSKLAISEMPVMSPPPQTLHAEAELRKVMDDFIKVYERLDTDDNALVKPNYSYTELVYLSILRSPNFCLPINEIYAYIKSRFSFFRNDTRGHWRNAVRHSLSKTKCFTKILMGRGVRVNGGSNRTSFLWCILPKSIVNFARGDYRPSSDKGSGTNTLRWGYYQVNAGQFWSQVALYLERKFETFQMMISHSSNPGEILLAQKCNLCTEATGNELVNRNYGSPDVESFTQKENEFNSVDIGILKKMASEKEISFGNDSGIDDIASQKSPAWNENNDSGNETLLESSPDDNNFTGGSYKQQHSSFNSSYLANVASPPDLNRISPELPDLGHVSPFELSPVHNTDGEHSVGNILQGLSPLAAHQNPGPICQSQVMFPAYYDSYRPYYSAYGYGVGHGQYGRSFDGHVGLLGSVHNIQESDPLLSTLNLHEWSQAF